MTTPVRIVVAALGGEGGGVLAKWIADTADREGYLSQTTSVPGVAQRTGATIYYIEIFPREEARLAGRLPVMSMFPTPGDVDIVICSEIVEAGRMIQRGFVTPDRTTLVTSTHRTYGISEKEAMGDGVVDKDAIIEVARANASLYIGFDMLATAREFNSVINAALFGALAATGVLPFARAAFEQTIRLGEIAVAGNLDSFGASFELARQQRSGGVQFAAAKSGSARRSADPRQSSTESAQALAQPAQPLFVLPVARTVEGAALLARVGRFPAAAREMIVLGVEKLVNYQDWQYAHDYLDRLEVLASQETSDAAALTLETARFLGLWMAFEDLPRVAQLKISPQRFERFREEVKAGHEQQVGMVEFLHPRVEEFCGIMPARLGSYLLGSPRWRRVLGLFARPRKLRTNSVHGFLTFYLLAKLRRWRRASLVFQLEQAHIEGWLGAVTGAAQSDYDLAVELARCGRLVKGYGSTRERGTDNLKTILEVCRQLAPPAAAAVAALREAALADDEGRALAALAGELLGRGKRIAA